MLAVKCDAVLLLVCSHAVRDLHKLQKLQVTESNDPTKCLLVLISLVKLVGKLPGDTSATVALHVIAMFDQITTRSVLQKEQVKSACQKRQESDDSWPRKQSGAHSHLSTSWRCGQKERAANPGVLSWRLFLPGESRQS